MMSGRGYAGEGRSSDERANEEENLEDSMSGLAKLTTEALPLRELLTRVATYAVQAIPGADGAGLTLIENERADTIVATADFVTQVDAIQYGLGDGPCIMAAREGRTVISRSLRDEERWGTFGAQVADLGVHSVVSLPLQLGDGDVVGAMNVYAHAYDAFDERSAALGEAFAVPAAIAVQHAHVLEQTRRLAEHLQASLNTQMIVEQAVGVLIGRENIDADEARRRLEGLAEQQGERLGVVARALVDDAVHGSGGHDTAGPRTDA